MYKDEIKKKIEMKIENVSQKKRNKKKTLFQSIVFSSIIYVKSILLSFFLNIIIVLFPLITISLFLSY
jgi:hypothetical protein